MKEQVNEARREVQALSRQQEQIFKNLVKELGVEDIDIQDRIFDFLWNGVEDDVEKEAALLYGMSFEEWLYEELA